MSAAAMGPPTWLRLLAGVLVGWAMLAGAVSARAAQPGFRLGWTNNVLTLRHPNLPPEGLEVWYLEAFCRAGGWDRDWSATTLPHRTRLLSASRDGRRLKFLTTLDGGVEVRHEVRAGRDAIDVRFDLRNRGATNWPAQWFQPACIRVAGFTGRDQQGYLDRSFIFTRDGLRFLDQLPRTVEARYRGGQVYVPAHTERADANPRPICPEPPVNGLIGCVSADGNWILATASDRTHELFEGVYVCLHSDPRIDGLRPGERRKLRQKIYLVPNDPERLLKRYRRDFPARNGRW